MSTADPRNAAARENARQADGKFGTYALGKGSPVGLDASSREQKGSSFEVAEANISAVTEEAGLPAMDGIYRALMLSDMGEGFERRLATLDAGQVYDHYERHIGPAVDAMEEGFRAKYGADPQFLHPGPEADAYAECEIYATAMLENLRKTHPMMTGLYEVIADRESVHPRAFLDKSPYRIGEDYETYLRQHLKALGEELQAD